MLLFIVMYIFVVSSRFELQVVFELEYTICFAFIYYSLGNTGLYNTAYIDLEFYRACIWKTQETGM